jgi:hypothetical protein
LGFCILSTVDEPSALKKVAIKNDRFFIINNRCVGCTAFQTLRIVVVIQSLMIAL